MATRRVIEPQPAKEETVHVQTSVQELSPSPAPVTSSIKQTGPEPETPKPIKHDPRPAVAPKKDPASVKNSAPQKEIRTSHVLPKPAPKVSSNAATVATQKTKAVRIEAASRRDPKIASSAPKMAKSRPPSKKEPAKKPVPNAQTRQSSKKTHAQEEESQDLSSWPLIIVAAVLGFTILGIMWATWDNSNPPPVQNTSESQQAYTRFGYDPAKLQTFGNVYAEINVLDEKYQTNLHQERLGKDMIQPKFIAGYVDHIDALSAAVNASGSNETEINNQFLAARRRMLVSQDYFQKALRFGTKGVVTTTFNCADVPTVIKATEHYNQSLEIGRLAIPRLDFVLAKSGEARNLLGLNTLKMRWYVTTFGDIKHLIDTNLWLVDTLCVKRQSLNKTQDADLDKAREEFEEEFPGAVVP